MTKPIPVITANYAVFVTQITPTSNASQRMYKSVAYRDNLTLLEAGEYLKACIEYFQFKVYELELGYYEIEVATDAQAIEQYEITRD